MKQEKLVPNRRFAAFTDKWKKKTLKEFRDENNRYSFTGGPFGSDLKSEDYTKSGVRIIQLQNIGDGYFSNKYKIYTSEQKAKSLSTNLIYPNEIIIAKMAEPLARAAIIPEFEPKYLMASDGIRLKVDEEKFHIYFLLTLLNNEIFRKKALENSTGTTRKRIGLVTLGNLPSNIPEYKEQQNIGQFFKHLDEMITLEQRKIAKTKALKSAYLAEMFPAEGEQLPKRRFTGFTDKWEKVSLGEKFEFFKGKGLPLASFYEGKENPSIAYGHLYTKYSEVIEEVDLSSKDNSVLSKKGDLLFPGSSTVPNGTAQSNAIMLDNIQLGGDIVIARATQSDVYTPFLSYQINFKKEKLFPIITGTTITHMYGKDLENITYFFPEFEEQVRISEFIRNIDNIIETHEQKLEKLKATKQAYLHEMFV